MWRVGSGSPPTRYGPIPADQLALALAGEASEAWTYSFIFTNCNGTARMIERNYSVNRGGSLRRAACGADVAGTAQR